MDCELDVLWGSERFLESEGFGGEIAQRWRDGRELLDHRRSLDDVGVGCLLARHQLLAEALHDLEADGVVAAARIDGEEHARFGWIEHAHDDHGHGQVVLVDLTEASIRPGGRVPERGPHQPDRVVDTRSVDVEVGLVLAGEGGRLEVLGRGRRSHGDQRAAGHVGGQRVDRRCHRVGQRHREEHLVDELAMLVVLGRVGDLRRLQVGDERRDLGYGFERLVRRRGDDAGGRDPGVERDQLVESGALSAGDQGSDAGAVEQDGVGCHAISPRRGR